MRFSKSFIYTRRETPKDVKSISHDLTIRAGIAHQICAGHYGILPLGTLVLKKIENIVRQEMNNIGAVEVILPIMQSSSLWQESGRWDIYGEEMFKLVDRQKREFCLGPTHEEMMVQFVKDHAQKTKNFPIILFQFGTKFRDEKRPRGGLLRTREFIMKDAYSFDYTPQGLDESYQKVRAAYIRILSLIGVDAFPIPAITGEMGGRSSEEFLAPSSAGEDHFIVLESGIGKKLENEDYTKYVGEQPVLTGTEICHCFKLSTRYSAKMGLFTNNGKEIFPAEMGCYGMGISRILPIIIEQNHDERGIIWPRSVAPFETIIITVQQDNSKVAEIAEKIYVQLGESALYDDRFERPGVKFRDAELIGIPDRIIVGSKGLDKNIVEYEWRSGGKQEVSLDNFLEIYRKIKEERK
jgi:prolyl-tRNA synthetase